MGGQPCRLLFGNFSDEPGEERAVAEDRTDRGAASVDAKLHGSGRVSVAAM